MRIGIVEKSCFALVLAGVVVVWILERHRRRRAEAAATLKGLETVTSPELVRGL